MLRPLLNNLLENTDLIIKGKVINPFHFLEYLMDVLIRKKTKIRLTNVKFLKIYEIMLKEEYAKILDHVNQETINGNIIGLGKYVRSQVNGKFTSILENFIFDYEKNSN